VAAKGLCRACYKKQRRKEKGDDYRAVDRAYYERNKERLRKYNAEHARKKRASDPERARKIQRDWGARNKARREETARKHFLRKKYSLSVEDYERLLTQQGGRCAICEGKNKTRRLAVDHCHVSGKVRALLCSKCNSGIGQFDESRDLLLKAISYLEKHK
jgi:hypothetical protein